MSPGHRSPARNRQAGLTLIEMLVVLAVVGVAAGATMLGLNAADRGARAGTEAVRLARHLTLAVDEALIAGVPLALVWDTAGYRFLRWNGAESGWQPDPVPLLSQRRLLRQPLVLGTADDLPGGSVLVTSGGNGAATLFRISGAGPAWQVAFDGFSATAAAEAEAVP